MKYVINGKFLTQRITGVQRYARELVAALDEIGSDLDLTIALPTGTKAPRYKNIKTVTVGKKQGIFWEQWEFASYVRKQKAVSLNFCNAAPFFCKKIVAVHDVRVKAHPEAFSKKFVLWYNLLFGNITKKALKIITVSQFSKREIIKYYPVAEGKIEVIGNAWQHYNKVGYDEKALEKYALTAGEYFFAMSSLEPNKNIQWIIEEAKRNPDQSFAIAGGLNNKVFAERDETVPTNVKFIGYVSDEEAKTLLKECKAFVFPTFYEGFGIPPMEALCAGAKKIIVSNTEVMHEIFKNAVVYIEPDRYDYDLEKLIQTECLDESDSVLCRYSWEESARKLKKVLEEL